MCTGATLRFEIGVQHDTKDPMTRIFLLRPGLSRELIDIRYRDTTHQYGIKPDCPLNLLNEIRFSICFSTLCHNVAVRQGLWAAIDSLPNMPRMPDHEQEMPNIVFEVKRPPHLDAKSVYRFQVPESVDQHLCNFKLWLGCDECPVLMIFSAAWDLFRLCPVSIKADADLAWDLDVSTTLGGTWDWDSDTCLGLVDLDWQWLLDADREWRLLEDIVIDLDPSLIGARLRSCRPYDHDQKELLGLINDIALEEDKQCLVQSAKARLIYWYEQNRLEHVLKYCDTACCPARNGFDESRFKRSGIWLSNEEADEVVSISTKGRLEITDEGYERHVDSPFQDPYIKDKAKCAESLIYDWEWKAARSSCGFGW